MKYITKRIKISLLLAVSAMMILFLSSCNKQVEQLVSPASPVQGTTPTLANLLDDPTYSIFKAAVVKAGLLPTLATTSLRFTMFIPNDAAMTASGLSLAVINALPATSVTAIVSYHILPQVISSTSIPTFFPNFAYPTIYNPLPPSPATALVRLTTSPSNRNGFWLNNVPITQLDIPAVNGVAYKIALATAPPSRYLSNRILDPLPPTANGDPDLTIFKAAIQRADSGLASTNTSSLTWALSNFGPNLTVFAPSNQAMKNAVAILTGGAINNAQPDATYISFLGGSLVTTLSVKGIVVYHILGQGRAFLNNFPTTATAYPTLFNGAIPSHPGVTLKVTFTGPTTITSATVKGVGVANVTASNIAINPTPDPGGTSDQHFINGTLHKIDQVLFPQ